MSDSDGRPVAPEQLVRLLGGPDLAWLVDRVRRRPLDGDGPMSGVVVRSEPAAGERVAITRLIGSTGRGSRTLRVDLAVVEQVLRRGPWPAGLADAVVTLSGPVVDQRVAQEREARAWAAAADLAVAELTRHGADVCGWWLEWCAAGALKRAARAEARRLGQPLSPAVGVELVTALIAVLRQLPADGQPLAVLARRVVGDAHALDRGRPLGRLAAVVVDAVWSGGDVHAVRGGAGLRELWAAVGVGLSALSSTVICLGVPGRSDAEGVGSARATAVMLEAMRTARMPVVLSLDQARSGGVAPAAAGAIVHICENPTVVEVVADQWSCQPTATQPIVVCTFGQPSAAVLALLQELTTAGAHGLYHGDFDWGGLRIAQALRRQIDWMPWRYGAADYRAAVSADRPSRSLTGLPAESPWDPELAAAMSQTGLAVEEEAVADQLAADVLGGAR